MNFLKTMNQMFKTLFWNNYPILSQLLLKSPCDKKFSQLYSAKNHERIYTGETFYDCKYCYKKYIQSQTAKANERSHTSEKIYACKYCDRDFAHLRSLKTLFTLEKNKFAFRIVTTKLQLKPV